MNRSVWKGHIRFGLVTIPVAVVSAENKTQEIDFDLLDRRDHAHVGFQRINKKTGEPIESTDIVRGLRLKNGRYAVFEPGELSGLRVRGAHSLEIQQFVPRAEIHPIYFRRAYYLEPPREAHKTYALLRETLRKTGTFGVSRIILRGKQRLVLIGEKDRALVLHVIHYPLEIRDTDELKLPAAGIEAAKVGAPEIRMAEQIVEGLVAKWDPESFRDTYFEDVEKAVQDRSRRKVRAEDEREEPATKVLDLRPLLRRSLKPRAKRRTGSRH